MTKAQYAPGPWFIKPAPSGGWRRYIMRDPQKHELYALAVTDEANARLIAAAPELLWFAEQMVMGITSGMICIDTPAEETLERVIKAGRTAVAKATGQVA